MELLSYLYICIDLFCLISMIANFAMTRWGAGVVSFLSLFLYPWVLEPILWVFYRIIYKCTKRPYQMKLDKNTANLIYHPDYNVKLCGIEKKHPFDSCKYERVLGFLKNDQDINLVGPKSKIDGNLRGQSDSYTSHFSF